jgi:hypothetical protein
VIASKDQGFVAIQNSQNQIIAKMSATTSGNGIIQTFSPLGITSNSVTSATSTSTKKGDLDNDGDVDGDDFLIFSENFNK